MNSSKKKCSNCSNTDHDFNKCELPIVSTGIIIFNDDKKVLMIRRRNTMAFIDLVRGRLPVFKYMRVQEKVKILVQEITLEEKNMLMNNTFEELWDFLWRIEKYRRRREFSHAKRKFESIISIIKCLLETHIPLYDTPEYSFPKGRKNSKENYLECAIREVEEETGYKNTDYEIINGVKFSELYMASNGVEYSHDYYLAKLKNNIKPRVDLDKSEEVGLIGFFDKQELQKLFREYEHSKFKIIEEIFKKIN